MPDGASEVALNVPLEPEAPATAASTTDDPAVSEAAASGAALAVRERVPWLAVLAERDAVTVEAAVSLLDWTGVCTWHCG